MSEPEKPGEFPYTRGIYPDMYRSRLWTMRQYAGLGDADESNRRYRYLISKGGEIRSTAEWRQGLLDAIRKDNKPELYDLVKEVNDRERRGK